MQRIVNILIVFKEYVVLAVLIILSLILLSMNDNRQIRVIRSYTVGFVGVLQDALAVIPNVFELKRQNEVLRKLAVNLSNEVNLLREARLENIKLRRMLGFKDRSPHQLVAADVVGKSLLLLRNTVTLDAGEQGGIRRDMPIVSEAGLVGRVIATSERYSVGQILFNKDFRCSARIQRSRVDGILAWDGGETLKLKNVAKMQDVRVGDLLVTSEYSSVFPRDIKIGVVAKVSEIPGSLFKEIDVMPGVDFTSLEHVFVITAVPDSERVALEKPILRSR